ncbi:MAG: carbohydrate-binding domain-containing protein [Bacteroidales bacterium]|nr:carbohydrate-binding domain-containing protein [Bacteroidales bacterium]
MIKHIFIALCATCLLTYGCDFNNLDPENGSDDDSKGGVGKTEITVPEITLSTSYSDGIEEIPINDEDYIENSEFTKTITIAFLGTNADVSGIIEGIEITKNGADVVINSSNSGMEYLISGTTTNGSIKIYSTKKFKLTLNGANITSTTGAAINIQSSKRAFVVVTDGTTNTLTDADSYTATVEDEDMKSTLFSEGQLVFSGKGSLTIKGNYKHAICSDDYVRIRKNTNITISGAAKDGIHANDYFIQEGGNLQITSKGDGIEAEAKSISINGGQLAITTTGTASKGIKTNGYINITGGKIIVNTSGNAEYDNDDLDISSSSAIKCDGNFTFSNATALLTSTGSAGKGINIDGDLVIESGTLVVRTSGKQYVYGTLDSSAKGIKAEGNLTINGGELKVICSGGEGSEGIESKSTLTINGGTIEAECYDDCINAADAIIFNGGNTYCYSSNNDGIDSNGTLTIKDGLIISSGTTAPEEGMDCDQNNFAITGGTIIGVGGATSTPTTKSCTQRSLVYGTTGTSGKLITITDSDGNALMTYDIPRNYNNQMTLLYSGSGLISGLTYTIYTGGTISGGTTFHGFSYGHTYTKGSKATTFSASSMVTTAGSTNGGGGGKM